jgi:hypothetical protein
MSTSGPEISGHLTSGIALRPAMPRTRAVCGTTLALCLLSVLPALAQHHPGGAAKPPLFFATAAERQHAQNHPECTCRAGGESFQLGAQICIGNQVVRCAMDLNVTSWKSIGSACPQS